MMRRVVALVGLVLSMAIPACVMAQSAAVDAPVAHDSGAVMALPPLPQLFDSPRDAFTAELLAPEALQPRQARQRRESSPRSRIIVAGAIIGAVGGAVYGFQDARHGPGGELGALLAIPLGLVAGGWIGAGTGYVVSLAIYPPER